MYPDLTVAAKYFPVISLVMHHQFIAGADVCVQALPPVGIVMVVMVSKVILEMVVMVLT